MKGISRWLTAAALATAISGSSAVAQKTTDGADPRGDAPQVEDLFFQAGFEGGDTSEWTSFSTTYIPNTVIRAGEGIAERLRADAGASATQITLWPGTGVVGGYARALGGGDSMGFSLVQQSSLHRERSSDLLPPRTESWQLVRGLNTIEQGTDVRASLTNPADPAQSISTATSGELRSYSGTTLDAKIRDYHVNPGAVGAAQQAMLGELLLLDAQGRDVTPTIVYSSILPSGSRVYETHIPVLNGATIIGGVPAQIEVDADATQAILRYTSTCLANNCADPGVNVNLRLSGPGGQSQSITWRGPGDYDPPVTVPLAPLLAGCVPGEYTLCPQEGEFAVNVSWRDFQGRTGVGHATMLSDESGDFWFFSDDNNELIIKLIDACSYTGNYWVFWDALSNVEFDLSIRNTRTDQVLTYHNPLGFAPNGHSDTGTIFRCDGSGPSGWHYDTSTDLPPPGTPQVVESEDPSLIAPSVPSGTSICLQGGRFKVEASWRDFQGNTGQATLIKKNEQSGYGWFFSSTNYELLFKIINACDFTQDYWIFIAGLTNVEATLKHTDTWTGKVYEQRNALGTDFPTNLDTSTNFTDCSVTQPFSDAVTMTGADATDVWNGLQTVRARTRVLINHGAPGHVSSIAYAPSVSPLGRLDGIVIRAFDNQFDADGLADFNHDPEEHLEAKLSLVQTRQGLAYLLTAHPNNTDTEAAGTDPVEISVITAAGTLRVDNAGNRRAILYASDPELDDALRSDATFDGDARLTYQLLPHMMNTWDCGDIGFTEDCKDTETMAGPTSTPGTHLIKGYGFTGAGADYGVIAATVQNTYVSGRLDNSPFVVDYAQTSIPVERNMLFWIKHIEPREEFYTNSTSQGNVRLNPRQSANTSILYDNSTTDADLTWTTPFPDP